MKFFLALAVTALVIYVLHQLWLKSSRRRFLAQFQLPAGVAESALQKRPELTREHQTLVQRGLQQYFRICAAAGGRFVSMPSQVVDELWHEFILFTRVYPLFCERAFGRYLHHTPAQAMPAPPAAVHGMRRAWQLACKDEGINPRKPERLPLLFALDAQLGIAGGFVYVLDRHDAAASSDGAFCASDLGGYGGASGDGSDSCSGDSGGCGGDGGGGDGGGD